jgi:hypothetical protein
MIGKKMSTASRRKLADFIFLPIVFSCHSFSMAVGAEELKHGLQNGPRSSMSGMLSRHRHAPLN